LAEEIQHAAAALPVIEQALENYTSGRRRGIFHQV
jgi:hypothetical protein